MSITADINNSGKSADRDITFIFDVVSESVIGFLQTFLVLLKMKGTSLKEIPLNRKRGSAIMYNHVETFYFFMTYNVCHKVFTQIAPF